MDLKVYFLKLKNISFSSRTTLYDPYLWAYELEELGFKGWEIVQEGFQCLRNENLSKLKDIYETTDLKITIHLPFSDMNLACLNDNIHVAIIEQLKTYLEIASPFVELAVIHPGHYSPYGSLVPSKAWKQNIESLQIIADTAENYNIDLALENMPNVMQIMGTTPNEIQSMLESVNRDNIHMTFDIGHANTSDNINEFITHCSSFFKHFHIHDNHGNYDEHLPIGRGNINWKPILHKLSNTNSMFVAEMNSLEEGIDSINYIRKL